MLDPDSVIPLYYQLREIIRERILTGEWEEETEIPSEKELMQELGVSRQTIRGALSGLVDDGLIYRRKGKGTFVSPQRLPSYLKADKTFIQDVIHQGGVPSCKVIVAEEGDACVLAEGQINCFPRERIFKLQRLRFCDELPVMLETTFLSLRYAGKILEEDYTNLSVLEYVEKVNNFKFKEIKTTVQIIFLKEGDAALLKLAVSSPVLCVRNTALLEGTPIVYGERLMRGDQFVYSLNYKIGKMGGINPMFQFFKDGLYTRYLRARLSI